MQPRNRCARTVRGRRRGRPWPGWRGCAAGRGFADGARRRCKKRCAI